MQQFKDKHIKATRTTTHRHKKNRQRERQKLRKEEKEEMKKVCSDVLTRFCTYRNLMTAYDVRQYSNANNVLFQRLACEEVYKAKPR